MLITLSIIGVVAALTIPTLTRKFEKQQWITQYKSTYSILSQATMMIVAKNNGNSLVGVWQNDEDIYNAYTSYLKVSKKCENQNNYGSCFASNYTGFFYSSNYSVVLANGTALGFFNFCPAPHGNCSLGAWVYILIDTNGKKGPNVLGKDFHVVEYTGTSIIPYGSDVNNLTEEQLKTNCPDDLSVDGMESSGNLCGIRIMRGDYGLDY